MVTIYQKPWESLKFIISFSEKIYKNSQRSKLICNKQNICHEYKVGLIKA